MLVCSGVTDGAKACPEKGESVKNILILWMKMSYRKGYSNYEEVQAAVSRTDFGYKVSISLKEIRESNYWLRIIKLSVRKIDDKVLAELLTESVELKNILGSIVQKCR